MHVRTYYGVCQSKRFVLFTPCCCVALVAAGCSGCCSYIKCRSFHSTRCFVASCSYIRKTITEITKNGYTRSSNNHFRVQRNSSTRTPPGRPLIGRTTIVPGSGSKQSGCTRCAELMFRSTRYWLPLYPDLVRSVQATRRRAHTPTRARVHTRISE